MGVRRLAGARRRDQRERAPARGRRRGREPPDGDVGSGSLPPCDFGIVATKAMHTKSAIAATAHAFADGAVATVQNGVGNEEVVAAHVGRVIRGTTFPAGKILEPGVVQWDVKGDTTLGPVRAAAGARRGDRASRGRVHARWDADGSGRRRTPRPVAKGDLQLGDESCRRPHGPHARTRLRATRPTGARERARRRGKGGRVGAGHRPRRRSRRSSSTTPRDPTSPTGTRRACSRTSRRAGRPRSTS